jgi:hypothetical protein
MLKNLRGTEKIVGAENKFHVIFLLLKYLFLNRLLDALYVTLSNK